MDSMFVLDKLSNMKCWISINAGCVSAPTPEGQWFCSQEVPGTTIAMLFHVYAFTCVNGTKVLNPRHVKIMNGDGVHAHNALR